MGQSPPPLRTVERAFTVVTVLQRLNGAGPAALATHMDIPKSTAHDYLRTLESTGYVVREDGQYHVGYRFLAVGSRLKHRNRLFHVAEPELEKLAAETGELSNIGIEEDGNCVILHSVEGTQSLDLGIYSGLRLPIYSHATGKAILAHLPEDYAHEVIDSKELEQITEHTVTNAESLMDELETIREEEYAVDWDQQVTGMGVVAVPILVDAEVLGAVAIVCPTGRLQNQTYREELIQKVRETANTIMVNYQYGR
jgi:DNA-binding IclR family transcriptional regulator